MTNDIFEVEAECQAMRRWADHVIDVANATLLPRANHSWYLGANIQGKPRVFMPYAAGLDKYRAHCQMVETNGYTGFKLVPDPRKSGREKLNIQTST